MSIPKDHLIETRIEEIGKGQNSNKRYRLRPIAPLPSGEYCLSRKFSACYDFGVDFSVLGYRSAWMRGKSLTCRKASYEFFGL